MANQNKESSIFWSWKALVFLLTVVLVVVSQISSLVSNINILAVGLEILGDELVYLGIVFLLLVLTLAILKSNYLNLKSVVLAGAKVERLVVGMLIISFVVVLAYFGGSLATNLKYLALGNYIEFNRIHGSYLIKAQAHFDDYELDEALKEVESCFSVTKSYSCKVVADEIKARKELSDKVYRLAQNKVLSLRGRIKVLRDYDLISMQGEEADEFLKQLRVKGTDLKKKYKQSIEYLTNGRIKEGLLFIDELDSEWSDYGNNRALASEVLKLKSTFGEKFYSDEFWERVENKNEYPYWDALKRHGASDYIDITVANTMKGLDLID
ncbi:hypothetical protein FLL45_19790 [Aliikangiella marina]|uniref:Uncharacterized protein n=1 Tax=Aliikangiella marina TaxID=1712262 RepID=A0A545T2F5_9GAMM|nr:hypothetical protein [Aliikangiella marina]TQV71400.1 hypothetical protein FLL45_19790 [Aliikangiella marina]